MPQPSSPPTAPALSDDLLQAARAVFPDLTSVAPVTGHPDIARIETPAGTRRIRRWPEGVPASDVAFSREVRATARAAGLGFVPELVSLPDAPLEAALRFDGRLYDAQAWMPGAPLPRAEAAWPGPDDRVEIPAVLPRDAFTRAIAATAQVHDATSELATRDEIPAAPLAMLPGAVAQAHQRHFGALRSRARHEPAIQRWLATGERLLATAEPIVAAAAQDEEMPQSILHLGLWPAHLLLDGNVLAGLLGWERVAAGSPLLDLAQATLRLQGWSDDAVETAVATYADVRQLTPEERRLLPAVAALDAVATTGRLLEQTFAVAETARPSSALRAAIDMMLRSLSALDRNLTTQAAVGKSKRTPWRRGPRPAARREGGKPRERERRRRGS